MLFHKSFYFISFLTNKIFKYEKFKQKTQTKFINSSTIYLTLIKYKYDWDFHVRISTIKNILHLNIVMTF